MHQPDVTGFILAGGKSTRMGRDKAALLLDGRTLLEHALDVLRQTVGNKSDAVSILGSRQLYSGHRVPVVEDIFPGCGPLSGIHAALTHTRTEFNLIIAVDTPFLSADFLRFMVKRAVAAGAVVTTPEIGGYRQPLCSVYSRDFLPIAEEALKPQRTRRDTEGLDSVSPRRHGDTEEQKNLTADERGSTRINPTPLKRGGTEQAEEREGTGKSRDYKIVPLFPEDRTLVITEEEMRRFAFTPEMFENLNTPDDLERARRREQKG